MIGLPSETSDGGSDSASYLLCGITWAFDSDVSIFAGTLATFVDPDNYASSQSHIGSDAVFSVFKISEYSQMPP